MSIPQGSSGIFSVSYFHYRRGMVGEQREGQDIVGRIEEPTGSNALNEWILEDLRSRNREILDKEQARSRLSTFTLLASGAAVSFLVHSNGGLPLNLEILGSLALAVLFGFLGHMSLYFTFFAVVTSDYIRFDLLPRARQCLGKPSIEPYNWEEYLWQKRKESSLPMLAYYLSEGAFFVLPCLGFASYGFYRFSCLDKFSGIATAACVMVGLVLLWLALMGIYTSWKIAPGEKGLRRRAVGIYTSRKIAHSERRVRRQ